MHHVVSVCVHRGGWAIADATEGGVPVATWPTPEEAPPPGLSLGDVVALRPAAGAASGALDVIVFAHNGATMQVASLRKDNGTSEPRDAAAHIPTTGASLTPAVNIAPLSAGDYGDVVACDAYGVALVQIESAGVFGEYRYWGYLTPAARNPDSTARRRGRG